MDVRTLSNANTLNSGTVKLVNANVRILHLAGMEKYGTIIHVHVYVQLNQIAKWHLTGTKLHVLVNHHALQSNVRSITTGAQPVVHANVREM